MEYQAWEEVFDFNGTVASSSATSMVITNSDGSQTRISGTGLTYSAGELTGGTVTGFDRYETATSTVLISYTGLSLSAATMVADYETVQDIQADFSTLLNFVDLSNANEPNIYADTLIEFLGANGNKMQIIGTNFGTDPNNNDFTNRTVTEMRVVDANGNVLSTTGVVDYNLGLVQQGFGGGNSYLLELALSDSGNVFVDDSYSVNDLNMLVEEGAAAKAFDLNADIFTLIAYYNKNGIVADLAAGTVLRDGITDTFTGNSTTAVFQGSEGEDTIIMGGNLFSQVYGAEGNDVITGSISIDTIEGGDGDDIIEGGAGGDQMVGFAYFNDVTGNDTLAYYSSNAGVQINLADGSASGGHATGDIFSGFRNVIGSDFADQLTGSDENNVLEGGAGADTLDGGIGSDTASYEGSSARVIVKLSGGGSAAEGDAQGDVLSNIENLTGSDFNDQLTGSIDSNILIGGEGNDNLKGLEGDDELFGGAGDDILTGGGSNDTIEGGTGEDTIYGNSGEDTINGGDDNDTILSGSGIDLVHGDDGDDIINGQGDDDMLYGDAGEDDIIGGGGNDTIYGGDDDDFLRGSGNNDMLYGEEGDDTLQGGAGVDLLFGGDGNDILSGSTGGDRLDGGAGNDTMNGGSDGNRDIFVFGVGYDEDRINGFEQTGNDRIELDAALWAGNGAITDAQSVVDFYGSINGAGNLLTLDFGNGDILEIQNSAGIDETTLGSDIVII